MSLAVSLSGMMDGSVEAQDAFVRRTTSNSLGSNTTNKSYADSGTLYVATSGGLSISTDAGKTFSNRTTANGLNNNVVNSVVAVSSKVYAATFSGLSISTDGGATFSGRTTVNGLGSNTVNGVAVSGNNVYAATNGGLSISTDGGTSFSNKTTANGLGSNTVRGVYVDGSTIYVATAAGLSISTNGGTSFTNKTTANGLGSNNVYGVWASGTTIYVATAGGLSISTNSGATFSNKTTSSGLGSNSVYSVYAVGTTVYAGTSGGLSISTNSGTTFSNKTTANTTGIGSNTINGIFALNVDQVYASTASGLSMSFLPTTLVSASNPSVYGSSITLTATVASTLTSTKGSGTVTFKEGDTTLGTGTLASDGTTTFTTDALSVGSHSVVAQYEGSSSFPASSSSTLSQVVNKAAPSITTLPTATTLTFGQTLASSTLSGGVGSVPGTFAFTLPSTTPNAGSASQGVTFTPADTGNYEVVTSSVAVTVNKATPSITTLPTATTLTFGQTLASSTLSGGVGSVPGTFAFTLPGTTPNAGSSSQGVTFTPADTGNYEVVATTVNVTVLTPLEKWRLTNFGSPSNTGNGANDHVVAGDNLTNLEKYAYGLDPATPTAEPLAVSGNSITKRGKPTLAIVKSGTGLSVNVRFLRRKGSDNGGVTYGVQFSTDVMFTAAAASSATPVTVASDADFEVVEVAYPLFLNGRKAGFFRVNVTDVSGSH